MTRKHRRRRPQKATLNNRRPVYEISYAPQQIGHNVCGLTNLAVKLQQVPRLSPNRLWPGLTLPLHVNIGRFQLIVTMTRGCILRARY